MHILNGPNFARPAHAHMDGLDELDKVIEQQVLAERFTDTIEVAIDGTVLTYYCWQRALCDETERAKRGGRFLQFGPFGVADVDQEEVSHRAAAYMALFTTGWMWHGRPKTSPTPEQVADASAEYAATVEEYVSERRERGDSDLDIIRHACHEDPPASVQVIETITAYLQMHPAST